MTHRKNTLRKKHTLIVGGTRGVGSILSKTLAEEGHIVSVIGRSPPVESYKNIQNIHYWFLDLLEHDSVAEALVNIIEKNGKLDNVIFFQRYRGQGDSWKGEIEVSINSTKKIIENLSDKFNSDNGSSIVVVTSKASDFVAEEQPLSYHIAKAALNQMVRYYAVQLGPKGIRFNCVSPGIVLKEESKEFYIKNKKVHDLYKKITPLGRMVTSEDIVNLITFLCSDKASFITGQNIVVDGGVSLQMHESLARKLTS